MEKSTQLSLKLDRLTMLHHAARRREMQKIGLWRGQMPILEYALLHDGCSQQALADGLGLTPATVAVSTKRMERAGLLKKQADGDDLRRNKLFVTGQGRAAVRAGKEIAKAQNEELFSSLTEEEQDTLCALLDRLIRAVGGKADPLAPLENYILKNELVKKEKE